MIKNLTFILSFIFLFSCANYQVTKKNKEIEKKYYNSKGFALIYNEDYVKNKIINKKINNEELSTIHGFLKRNTPIKIINPENSKFVETKVYKNGNFPEIFNIVLSQEIAKQLDLNIDSPYVEIIEIKKNVKFIAKKSNTFDEEKNVAEKAPIDEIVVDEISVQKNDTKKNTQKEYNYMLIISDFYYVSSANTLKDQLINKNKITNLYVKKINDKKYRLYAGPFKNFNALKNTYISLNKLGFENLNINRESR